MGVALGPTWVLYRRMLMWGLPDNCVRRSSHWLRARYPNDDLVQKLPPKGSARRSIMKPGNASQWYRGDSEDVDLELYEEPKPRRIPTCPGDMFVSESIGASPNIFNAGQMNKLLTPGSNIGPTNLSVRCDLDEPENQVRIKHPLRFLHPPCPSNWSQ